MSENTRELIKQYFQSLMDQFIPNQSSVNLTIIFKDDLGGVGSSRRLGHTDWKWRGNLEEGITSGKHTFEVSFLNHYEDKEKWREVVCHEFVHVYFHYKSDKDHEHDETFYSKMDQFENWLDRYYGLSPRKNKGGDWEQHTDPSKRKQRENQYPNQPKNNDDNYSPPPRYRDTPEGKESTEWFHLIDLIQNAKTLTELENNWQTVKNSPLYDSNKKTFEKHENNKERLDYYHATYKRGFCTDCLNSKEKHQSNCPNKCGKCSHSRLKNGGEECHNINCDNYCHNPKWDREREERKKQTLSSGEKDEYNRLTRLMKNSKNLTEFEQNYQIVKSSSIYSSGKRFFFDDKKDIKTEFDEYYNRRKDSFQSPNSKDKPTSNPTPPTSIKDYFIKNNVKQITLQGEEWLIEHNDGKTQTTSLNNTELQELKSYLKNSNKNSLSQEDIDQEKKLNNPHNTAVEGNNKGWIILIWGVIIIVGIVLLRKIFRRKKPKK
jgi:hypothetical protein